MAKKTVKLDPDDELIVGEVGPRATEKHDRLRKYIQASQRTREVLASQRDRWRASYIELYSGADSREK